MICEICMYTQANSLRHRISSVVQTDDDLMCTRLKCSIFFCRSSDIVRGPELCVCSQLRDSFLAEASGLLFQSSTWIGNQEINQVLEPRQMVQSCLRCSRSFPLTIKFIAHNSAVRQFSCFPFAFPFILSESQANAINAMPLICRRRIPFSLEDMA